MQIVHTLKALTLAIALALCLASMTQAEQDVAQAGGNTACGAGPRVRRDWSSLNSAEKRLYLEAVHMAMKDGVIEEFAAIHVESKGETQAHRSCAFFSWHRRLILALESYLRSQAARFACLTIPYFDVQTAYVRQASGYCNNMHDCATILQEMGGNRASDNREYLHLNGRWGVGYPIKGFPFHDECDDDKTCGFMVRNDAEEQRVPSAAGFGNFMKAMHGSDDYASFLEEIQFGVHNEVHNAVGGAMATFAAPRDIFFFSWHSAVDMYLHVYHLCHFGSPLTDEDLQSAHKAFVQSTETCGQVAGVGPNTKIVQNVVVNNVTMDVSEHPTLGKFFAHVGDEMWNYGDITRLGDYSYSYDLPDMLTHQLLNNNHICPAFTSTVTESTTSPESGVAGEYTQKPTEEPADVSSDESIGLRGSSSSSSWVSVDEEEEEDWEAGPGDVGFGYTPTPAYSGIQVVSNSTESGEGSNGDTVEATVANSGPYWEWIKATYDGLYERLDGNMELVTQQLQYTECETYSKVNGGVEDLSSDFTSNFHLASSRPTCGKKVDEVEAGEVKVVCKTETFEPETIEFQSEDVVEEVKSQIVPTSDNQDEYTDAVVVADAIQQSLTYQEGNSYSTKTSTTATTDGGTTESATGTVTDSEPTPSPTVIDAYTSVYTPIPTTMADGTQEQETVVTTATTGATTTTSATTTDYTPAPTTHKYCE